MIDLTGSWLGTYWQAGKPTRFEATLVHGQNTLTGRITDSSVLGEASIDGEVSGRVLSFTKRYLNHPNYSIRYTGTVSDNGNYMSGAWVVNAAHKGAWEAQRNQDDWSKALKAMLDKKTPVGVN
jgi:hypothetical protein